MVRAVRAFPALARTRRVKGVTLTPSATSGLAPSPALPRVAVLLELRDPLRAPVFSALGLPQNSSRRVAGSRHDMLQDVPATLPLLDLFDPFPRTRML